MTVLELTSDEYHADPCEVPSLNSTTARVLLTRTPAHAKAQHPRLSDVPLEPKSSDAMDMGTAVHQLLLRDDRIEVADFENYRRGEAQAWRDEVRSRGRIPMLQHQWDRAQNIADAVREHVRVLAKPTPFTAGTPEATIAWEDERGCMCRARLDWLRDDLSMIDDLKVTSRSAEPKAWSKHIWNMGYDVQAAFYVRGIEKLHGVRPRFRWVVAESVPPYCVSVVTLDDADMFAAGVAVDTAIQLWNECMTSGRWPGYPTEPYVAARPGWAPARENAWADVDVDESVPF